MREWTGDYDDEEAHQRGFEANFRIVTVDHVYAKVTLDISHEGAEGLEVLDEHTWMGGSELASETNDTTLHSAGRRMEIHQTDPVTAFR